MHYIYRSLVMMTLVVSSICVCDNARAGEEKEDIRPKRPFRILTKESMAAWRKQNQESMAKLTADFERSQAALASLESDPQIPELIQALPFLGAAHTVSRYVSADPTDYPDAEETVLYKGERRKKYEVAREALERDGYTAPEYAFMLKKLAKQGHPLSQTEYGNCLIRGTYQAGPPELEAAGMCGVVPNVRRGIAYLLLAASQGEESAEEILGYYQPKERVNDIVTQLAREEVKPKAKALVENPAYKAFIKAVEKDRTESRRKILEKDAAELSAFQAKEEQGLQEEEKSHETRVEEWLEGVEGPGELVSSASAPNLFSLASEDVGGVDIGDTASQASGDGSESTSSTVPPSMSSTLNIPKPSGQESMPVPTVRFIRGNIPPVLSNYIIQTRPQQKEITASTILQALEEDAATRPLAQGLLGMVYYQGLLDLPRDRQKGLIFFQGAADRGEVEAARATGALYAGEDGMPIDYKLATKYLWQAVQGGEKRALWILGRLYQQHHEVPSELPQSEREALDSARSRKTKIRTYFQQAWEGGVIEASDAFVSTFGEGEAVDLLRYLEAAAARNQVNALGHLALFWDKDHPLLARDARKASEYYHLSALQQEKIGLFQMALYYFRQAQTYGAFQGKLEGKNFLIRANGLAHRCGNGNPSVIYPLLSQRFMQEGGIRFQKGTPDSIRSARRLSALALRLHPQNKAAWNNVGTMYLREKVAAQGFDLTGDIIIPAHLSRAIFCYVAAGDLRESQQALKTLRQNAFNPLAGRHPSYYRSGPKMLDQLIANAEEELREYPKALEAAARSGAKEMPPFPKLDVILKDLES